MLACLQASVAWGNEWAVVGAAAAAAVKVSTTKHLQQWTFTLLSHIIHDTTTGQWHKAERPVEVPFWRLAGRTCRIDTRIHHVKRPTKTNV